MQKVKTQSSGELCVENMLIILCFYMVIIKTYKVRKFFNKISGNIGINFRKFSTGNFQTHNPNDGCDFDGGSSSC